MSVSLSCILCHSVVSSYSKTEGLRWTPHSSTLLRFNASYRLSAFKSILTVWTGHSASGVEFLVFLTT